VRKPSPHTIKAYRQDFEAIAILITGAADSVADLHIGEVTKDTLRAAFAAYADTHSAASVRRCWSTWNTLCAFLFTAELLDANPMPLIGRPKVPKTLPKSYPAHAVTDLIAAIDDDHGSTRASDWAERDRAIVFTSLLAGLRADELLNANVGDLRRTEDGGVMHVRGKGNKDRRIPIGTDLLDVIDDYLRTRASRFPQSRRRAAGGGAPSSFSPNAALFVGADGERMTRGTLQYRVLRAIKKAGINGERASGTGSRLAAHLRHRTHQRQRERLRPDEAPRPRVHGHLTTLRRWSRHRNPCRLRTEPALRPAKGGRPANLDGYLKRHTRQ